MSSKDSPSEEREETTEVITKVQIALSVDLYKRASVICLRRNCTLEAVVEELVERFLPSTKLDNQEIAETSPHRIHNDVGKRAKRKIWWIAKSPR